MCVLSVGNGNFIVDFCGLSITDTTIMILALQSALLASQFEELKTPKIKENKLYNSGSWSIWINWLLLCKRNALLKLNNVYVSRWRDWRVYSV